MNHGDNALVQEIGCDVLCKLADYAVETEDQRGRSSSSQFLTPVAVEVCRIAQLFNEGRLATKPRWSGGSSFWKTYDSDGHAPCICS